MDAIRKKMQSLKGETDSLYATIDGFEENTREAAARADQVTPNHLVYTPILYSSSIRLTATSVTLVRKSSSSRLVSMRPTTS